METDNPMSINIDVNASANFDPLINATPKGVGRVFSLLFGKREADNLRYKMLVSAKTQKEYQQILSGEYTLEGDSVVPIQKKLLVECINPLKIEEKQEIKNFANNIYTAVEALKDVPDEDILDKEVDEDFFARWRREAKVIGHEDLQRLWGRLLAEEVKDPGRVPFRALDVLKNITSYEAKLFQKIAPYVTNYNVLICRSGLMPEGITLDDLLLLQDSGILLNVSSRICFSSPATINIDGEPRVTVAFKGFLFVSSGNEKFFKMPGVDLSSTGKLALTITDFNPPDSDQIKYLFKVLTEPPFGNIKRIKVYKITDEKKVLIDVVYDSKDLLQ